MQSVVTEPTTCPDCGHSVYRPPIVSVCHPQHVCRAVVSEPGADAHRCGCASVVHRVPAVRPRHRHEAGAVG